MVIYVENSRIDMVNRQKKKKIKDKSKKRSKPNETYSTPKVIAEPKMTEEEIEEINRENTENDVHNDYVQHIKKLSKHDLGVITNHTLYPNSKKDHSYNNGVQRAKDDLGLLNFLISNLKPRYKKQILGSSQFENVIKNYMGIDDFSEEPTEEEKKMMVLLASKMLINSITAIQKYMPHQFNAVLRETGKPYFTLIKAINDFGKDSNLKSIPPINIPDSLL